VINRRGELQEGRDSLGGERKEKSEGGDGLLLSMRKGGGGGSCAELNGENHMGKGLRLGGKGKNRSSGDW